MPSLSAVEAVTPESPAASACETYQSLESAGNSTIHLVKVSGSLNFDLSIPVVPRIHTADLHQTAQSSQGTSVTLERVVITPVEMRLNVQGPAAEEIAGGPVIAPFRFVDGKEVDGAVSMELAGGEEFSSVVANLYDDHGEWTLKVPTDPVMPNGSRSYTCWVTCHISMP